MIDVKYLQHLIIRSGYKYKHLDRFMRMSNNTFTNKLHGKTDFRLSEAQRLSRLLNMTPDETARCFWPAEEKEQRNDV